MNGINNTNTTSIVFRVVGRYMTGSAVTGYHLVGNDGSQLAVTKERSIYMIGKGLIENMRVQSDGSEIMIRGKGVNLNTLPIYDQKNNKFRGNQASQAAANTAVNPKKYSGVNPMGQVKIKKRIMYKTNCLGYMVVDFSGKEFKLSRDKVISLAIQKLVSNAVVQKYNQPGQLTPKLILRGVGCDLSELPALLVDSNGKILDPSKDKAEIKMRATRMKRGGIIHDKVKGIKIPFEAGDYLVCGIKAVLRVLKESEIRTKFKPDTNSNIAICDDYFDNLNHYPIEIFGNTARVLNPEQLKKWAIISAVNN